MVEIRPAKTVKMTRSLAEEIRDLPQHSGERKLKRRRVEWLRGKLKDGLFHTPVWSRVEMGGRIYRINGQHSSVMLCEETDSVFDGRQVHLDDYRADQAEDIAELFCQFDGQASTRTRPEIVTAHARVHGSLDELSTNVLGACVSGIAYGLCNASTRDANRYRSERRAKLLHDYTAFALWSGEFVVAKQLRSVGVAGAIFRTYEVNADVATRFWRQVRDCSHQNKDNPTRTLGRFLENNRLSDMKWDKRAFYSKCIIAWNAYRAGGSTTLSYFRHSRVPQPK